MSRQYQHKVSLTNYNQLLRNMQNMLGGILFLPHPVHKLRCLPSAQAKPSHRSLPKATLAGTRCPTSQVAGMQVDRQRGWVMLYYPRYPSAKLGSSHSFETMIQEIAVIWPPAH